jgi:hypothetical protein
MDSTTGIFPCGKNSATSDSIHCGVEKSEGFPSGDPPIAAQHLDLALGETETAGAGDVGPLALGNNLASSLNLGRFAIQQKLSDLGAMRAEELHVLENKTFHLKTRIGNQNHKLDAAGEAGAPPFDAEGDPVLLDRGDEVRHVHRLREEFSRIGAGCSARMC